MTIQPTPEFITLQRALAGRYSLDRELGRGGMGVVYLARDVSLERPVAIKLLPPPLAALPGYRDRFVREARTAAALAHPHIVPIHAVEERDGLVYFVMEYVAGETLGERVRRSGPLHVDEGTRLLREVAWALGHAHGRGIIHRDIKPDNILLEAGSGRAVVTDLGIAHAEGTAVSGASGTPHFVAPELLAGGAPSVASDIYALGVTAWVALAGKRPFEGSDGAALIASQAHAAAPSIRAALPRLASRLADAIDRSVARDPAERWPDAEAFAAELATTQSASATLPAPLRRFSVLGRSLGEQGAFGLSAAVVTEIGFYALYGDTSLAGIIFHPIALLLAAFGLVRLGELAGEVRALAREGWGQGAVVAADRAEPVQADGGESSPWPMLGAALLKGLAGAALLKLGDDYFWLGALGSFGMIYFPAQAVVRLLRDRTASDRSRWSRLLSGRLGRWLFKLAAIGLPHRSSSPVQGEPTALALGQSIDALYAALPAEHQKRLAEVPDLAARLQAKAFARGPERTPAVAALETLRLDILRLRAGTITEPELTADLEAVRRMGEEIDRVVAANAEVGRIVS